MANAIGKNDRFVVPVSFGDHGFGQIPPSGAIGPARWNWFDLLLVHAGTVRLEVVGAGRIELASGEGILILPQTPFSGRALAEGARISVQHFDLVAGPTKGWLPQPLAAFRGQRQGARPVRFRGTHDLDVDVERAIDLAFRPPSPALHDLRVAQLVLILGHLASPGENLLASAGDPRMAELLRRLAEADSQNVTVAAMARWVGLSPSRFRTWFRGQFGVSPKRYLLQRRTNRAMRLLRETREPIKAVADVLGYADLSAFYRDFRRHAGTTPADYRREHTVRA